MMAGALDSLTQIETPEGVELDLRLAGPVARILAWGIDASIRLVTYMFLTAVLGGLGKLGIGISLISVFVLEWFYPVLFEVYGHGATPGKRALGLRVLHDDGTPVAMSASMIRNLLRFVDFLPFLYGFGFVCMVLDIRFRRLGDLAAGTLVVYVGGQAPRVAREGSTAVPPPVVLTRAEQRAVMEFAERAPKLAPERANELAGFAGALVGGSQDAASRLYAMANYLAGSR